MKIIFLDFDGVVNRFDEPESFRKLSPSCVENLNQLIELSDANIVISSSWKGHIPLIPDLAQILVNAGFRFPEKVIGKTPTGPFPCRGREIEEWLKKCRYKIESFVILDDDSDMEPFLDRLVETDFNVGLTMCDVEKAIVILNSEE